MLLDGQHCVTEFGAALQGAEAGAQQQHRLDYEQTVEALYPLVSFEGRWMLDINSRYDSIRLVQPTGLAWAAMC